MTTVPAGPAASTRAGILLVVVGITMFAVLDVLSKILGQSLSVVQIIWVRFLLFVPFALALAWRPGQGIAWRSATPALQAIRAVVLLVEMWFFLSAFAAIPLADAHAIGAFAPLLVTALSVPFLGERVGWRRWAAIGVGFGGIMLILRPGFAELTLPILYAVVGALLWAVYQILLKIVGRRDSAATTGVWTAAIGAVGASAIGPFFWTAPDAQGWMLLVVAAFLGGAGRIVYSKAFTLAASRKSCMPDADAESTKPAAASAAVYAAQAAAR